MKFPTKIKLGPHLYDVVLVPSLTSAEGQFGSASAWKHQILIDANVHQDEQWQILMHECLHTLNDDFHLAVMDDDAIDRMATVLLQFLIDNGWAK